MPEDVGGGPFPDGREPDDDQDRGGSDDEFATVVFDEDFVRGAEIHEPSAVERLLAAAQARAEAEAARARHRLGPPDDDHHDDALDGYETYGGYGSRSAYGRELEPYDEDAEARDAESRRDAGPHPYGPLRPYRSGGRWHRPVAWALAVIMGVGMVALAFSAVYRGAPGGEDPRRVSPPVMTEGGPSASPDYTQPPVPAEPRTP
ncbi:hypothetical protein [Streptomyces sp. NPDC060194]|uniref:SCO2584 family spore wall biosynthesis protein n=1 Tax=Streptomyces sp. NPDC060194 TaxID=3347069 RepID=UPI0036668E68